MRQGVEDYGDGVLYQIFVLQEEDLSAGVEESRRFARIYDESFPGSEEALDWAEKDLDYVDNFRFAYLDDENAVAQYWKQADYGCCGSHDCVVQVAGRPALVGCNYGH